MPLGNPELSREMYISKQIRAPLKLMADIVENTSNELAPKFLTYSAHDWTVATMLEFFNANNGNFTVVPFASSIHMELHSLAGCESEDCYWVEVFTNMQIMEFGDVCEIATRCTYSEFMDVLLSRNFVYTHSHYEQECSEKFMRPLKESQLSEGDAEKAKMHYEKYRLF